MDSIDVFDIHVDIDDRKHLYDYVTGKRLVHPQSGQWDAIQFRGLGNKEGIPSDNKKLKEKVQLMDNSITDIGCLEKKAKGKKDDSKVEPSFFDMSEEKSSVSLPRRVLPVYKPGDTVSGSVVLKVNKPFKADYLTVNLSGYAHVNIRVYHRYGYTDVHKEEYFLDQTITLWEKSHDGDKGRDFSILDTSSLPARSSELPVGHHTFTFAFVLPSKAPQSIPNLTGKTINRGYLVYRLKAKIDKGRLLSLGNINTHKGIWVVTPVDISSSLQQASALKDFRTGIICAPGRISVRAYSPTTGVLLGNPVPVTIDVDNKSNDPITGIEAYIRFKGRARPAFKRTPFTLAQRFTIKSERCYTGEVISPGMCPSYQLSIPWDFSGSHADGNLLPVGSLYEVSLLEGTYDVIVKIVRKSPHRDFELSLPITVGNYSGLYGDSETCPNSLYY